MPGLECVSGSKKCIKFLLDNYKFNTVLDIGCGHAPYIDMFLGMDMQYTGLDAFQQSTLDKYNDNSNVNLINSHIFNYETENKYDCVFSCHVVEHVADTESFIRHKVSFVNDGSVFCILWPKPKPQIVGGHVHIFSPGLMMYNLVRIGLDCSGWKIVECDYTYGVMGTVRRISDVKLTYANGELERLNQYFPFDAVQNFHGVNQVNIRKL